MGMTVGELSRLSGVTVRTLHHYDEIGLLRPSHRSANNYRLYGADDVYRLQQVLLLRELGVPLEEIGAALDDGSPAQRADLLRRHRAALLDRRGRLDAMLASVDHALQALEKGTTQMTSDDFQKLFDGFDPARYEKETEQRWGNTPLYAEAKRRTKSYGPADWERIKTESEAIYARFVALMQAPTPPDEAAVQAVVEEHRQHICRWYYECSKSMHHGLGEMYVADPRFRDNIDRSAPGLALFMSEAIARS